MSNNIKRITFEDAMDLSRDEMINREFRQFSENAGMAGIVTMREPESGRVVFSKRHNLIVLRGRVFALEKLFDDPISSYGVNDGARPYISDMSRKIVSFGVGKGGAPASDPFTPYGPPPTGVSGVQLSQRVPFRLHDTTQSATGDPQTFIPSTEIGNYGNAEAVPGQPTQSMYYLKHFDSRDPVWFFDEATNTVYKQITMSITGDDCRAFGSNQINELCLYFATVAGADANGGVLFSNPEMFSRITFPTEYLGPSKALEVVYNVYA